MVKKKKPSKPSPRPKPKQPRSAEARSPMQSQDEATSADPGSNEAGKAAGRSTGTHKAVSRPALAAATSVSSEPQPPSKRPKGETQRKGKTSPKTAVSPAATIVTPGSPRVETRSRPDAAPGPDVPSTRPKAHTDRAISAARNEAPPRMPSERGLAAPRIQPPQPPAPKAAAISPPSNDGANSVDEPAARVDPRRETGRGGSSGEAETFSAAASQPFQDFATETQRIARESFEETTNLIGKLRGAKNPMELVALQTTYMQHSLRMCTAFAQGVGKLMAMSQSTLMKQGQATIESLGSITGK